MPIGLTSQLVTGGAALPSVLLKGHKACMRSLAAWWHRTGSSSNVQQQALVGHGRQGVECLFPAVHGLRCALVCMRTAEVLCEMCTWPPGLPYCSAGTCTKPVSQRSYRQAALVLIGSNAGLLFAVVPTPLPSLIGWFAVRVHSPSFLLHYNDGSKSLAHAKCALC